MVLIRLVVLAALFALAPGAAHAQDSNIDPRFCGVPARDDKGEIARSMLARALFVRMHPCPATGAVSGACPGWSVDHVIPLACGGCDSTGNLQWLPLAIKSCAASTGVPCKDRFERRIYRTTIPC